MQVPLIDAVNVQCDKRKGSFAQVKILESPQVEYGPDLGAERVAGRHRPIGSKFTSFLGEDEHFNNRLA